MFEFIKQDGRNREEDSWITTNGMYALVKTGHMYRLIYMPTNLFLANFDSVKSAEEFLNESI